MQDALRRLKPSQFTDLVAMNALYRPGPMEMIPAFIDRKLGRQKFEYLHPKLEPILKETFGIIVYQEQVIRMASDFAGFTLAKADLLRRAMGKKDKELMLQQRKQFISGAIANGYTEKLAIEIFDLIEKFASYGFNKSHSVAYAKLAYQTAFLKTYFPAEFMAATLSTELGDNTRIGILIEDCRKHDIAVLAPDVNESAFDFFVTKGKILFGLSAIKGVGTNAVENIINARENGGKFLHIFDFISRVNLRLVNKRTLEGLIQSGAFDALHSNRAQLFKAIERITIYGQTMQENRQQGQSGLFETSQKENNEDTFPVLPNIPQWSESEKLTREKEVLGFFVSGHPLQNYRLEIESFATTTLGKLDDIKHGEPIRVCGIISDIKKKTDKRGGAMAFIALEDNESKRECIVFAKVYEKNIAFVQEGKMVMVIGKNDMGGEIAKIIADEFLPIEHVAQKFARGIKLSLDVHSLNENNVQALKQMLEHSKGTCFCYIDVYGFPAGETKLFKSEKYNIAPSKDLMQFLQNTFGKDAVSILKQ
jgi:DNA polymerase-3 subunit alpha